ncbi:MAG: hypothetical protein HQL43_04220 [Alphaproteobacteria bacterium]|nr:hypothetical protein [Alphaproteobacteria bacterium]
MRPVIIDLEASSLNKGFPIEVGWVEVDEDNRLRGQAHLIRPTDEWLQDFVWDRGAQAIHGIRLDLLQEMGLAPIEVVQKLGRNLGDAIAFTDNPIADGHWLGLLYAAAGHPMRLRLADVELAYNVFRKQEHQNPGEREAAKQDASRRYIAAEQLANKLAPITHAALANALHHAAFYLLLRPGGDSLDAVDALILEMELVFSTQRKFNGA